MWVKTIKRSSIAIFFITLSTCFYREAFGFSDSLMNSRIYHKEVKMGISIAQIFDVEGATTQFSSSGYIFYVWKDTSLKYQPKFPGDTIRTTTVQPQSEPKLEFVNGKNINYQYEADLIIKPDGTILNKKKFEGVFFTPMNLRKFPFDEQNLEFIIEPFYFDTNYCKLNFLPKIISLGQNVHQEEWEFSAPKCSLMVSYSDPTGNAPFSRLTIKIHAKRKWNYYFWNVIFYLFIFVLISTSVYYVPVSDLRTSVRITLTLLLTVVAFHITLKDKLPSLPYRTFMDGFDYLCLFAILYNFILVFVNRQLLQNEKVNIVRKSLLYHRIFFVPFFILVFVVLYLFEDF